MSEHKRKHGDSDYNRVKQHVKNKKDRERVAKLRKKVLEQAQKLLKERNRAKAYQICRDIDANVDQTDAKRVGRWLGDSEKFEKISTTRWGLAHE